MTQQTTLFDPEDREKARMYEDVGAELRATASRLLSLSDKFDTSFHYCDCCGSKRFEFFTENVTAEQLRRWSREMDRAADKLIVDAEAV